MHNKTRNRGLAFVSMASPEEALAALSNLESYVSILFNRYISLNTSLTSALKVISPG